MLDTAWYKCSNCEQTYWPREVAMLVIAVAVLICTAYLLWQIWEADLAE
ncbi:MAG TPA: hypothetical protein VNN10_01580 [Dehalococcoidia bacterium]|nr:hypothetical protein [Dehalococcoidia bacterium]